MVSMKSGGAMVVMMIMMVRPSLADELIKVGDGVWGPNVNYTQWAARNRFYVTNWLIFYFDKHMFNVLEVNKTSYDNCNDQGYITNITKGGRDVFQLKEARPYYFLSSGGYCWNGMKLAISVEVLPPAPAPAPDNAAFSINERYSVLPVVISVVSALIVLFKK